MLSDFNVGAAAVLLDWLQYMHKQGETVELMNTLISNLPFTGEELYRFFAYDCNKDMDTFHFRMFGRIITKLQRRAVS